MSKITSRTVHVTVTFSVEIPAEEADSDMKARMIAQQVWPRRGQEFDSTSVVFERETQEEKDAAERKKFRDLHIGKKK